MSTGAPHGVTIRPARAADLTAVERMLTASRLPVTGVAPHFDRFFIAESGGGVVGTIGLERIEDDALIRSACIADEWRGRGVGSALVEHALTDAALNAVDAVYLITAGAERFFARFGFVPIGAHEMPITVMRAATRNGSHGADAMAMRLKLAPA